MNTSESNILNGADSLAIDTAVRALKSDLLVAIPTETVYGLAARASTFESISDYAGRHRVAR